MNTIKYSYYWSDKRVKTNFIYILAYIIQDKRWMKRMEDLEDNIKRVTRPTLVYDQAKYDHNKHDWKRGKRED